jgi:hypothetical protein
LPADAGIRRGPHLRLDDARRGGRRRQLPVLLAELRAARRDRLGFALDGRAPLDEGRQALLSRLQRPAT